MDTSVLLITFNRPTHTFKVLSAIREKQPKELFIFQDGARDDHPEDKDKCLQVREVVDKLVDWDCQLHTFYADRNYGCGAGPKTGISWFFSNVHEGIVMEDDCLPHPDFFSYCSELLDRYRDDQRVMYISSTLYDERWKCQYSYDFSHYMITGAWASWARAWDGFDLDLLSLDAKAFRKHCKRLLYSVAEADWWFFKALEIQRDKEKKSYWDYQMQIHIFNRSGLTLHPQVNLISNIGFDSEGTHTLDNVDNQGERQSFGIMPLSHPINVLVDTRRDYECFAKKHSSGWARDSISRLYKRMLFNKGIPNKLLMLYKKLKNGR